MPERRCASARHCAARRGRGAILRGWIGAGAGACAVSPPPPHPLSPPPIGGHGAPRDLLPGGSVEARAMAIAIAFAIAIGTAIRTPHTAHTTTPRNTDHATPISPHHTYAHAHSHSHSHSPSPCHFHCGSSTVTLTSYLLPLASYPLPLTS